MIVGYAYKMQWWFEKPQNAYKVIRAIGAKSLDQVNLRDKRTGKVVDTYSSMHMHPYGVADDETVKWIQKNVDKHPFVAVELLRRR